MSIKKSVIYFMILSIGLLIGAISYLEVNNTTIDKYINNQFVNAKVYKVDNDKKLLLFSSSNDKQYIFGKIRKIGRYYFDIHDEDGWAINDEPFLFVISHKKGIGNIVWGVFNLNSDAKKIELQFQHTENELVYSQEVTVEDNAYFQYLPDELINENFLNGKWRYSMKVYDDTNKLIYENLDSKFYYDRD